MYIVVVAGGSGTRMGSELPKQLMLLGGKPILMHTIDRFYEFNRKVTVLLVLPQAYHDYWRDLCFEHRFSLPHRLVAGGFTRFHSVKNALDLIDDRDAIVAIHDGVRPLVSDATLTRCFDEARARGAAIPTVPLKDSLRKYTESGSVTVDRKSYMLVQTPQVFRAAIVCDAYNAAYQPEFTDDASVVEKMGYPIALVEGNIENIKITYPTDIAVAEVLMRTMQESKEKKKKGGR